MLPDAVRADAAHPTDWNRKPAWLWFNLLSFDAPLVAVSWQAMLGAAFGLDWSAAHALMLGLTVWLIYVVDRLLDAAKLDLCQPHSTRHRFHRQFRRPLLSVAAAAALIDIYLVANCCSWQQLLAGVVVGILVILYAAGVHVDWRVGEDRTSAPRQRCLKECQVGIIFAMGVSLLAWCQAPSWLLLEVTALAALLFTINCLFVADWERTLDESQRFASMSRSYPKLTAVSPWLAIAVAMLAIPLALYGPLAWPLAWALITSGILLCAIRCLSCPTELQCLLADAALFAPAAVSLLFLL